MGTKGANVEFRQYRDQENERASHVALSRGLGINPLGTAANGIQDKISSTIEVALKQEGLEGLVRTGLAGLLTVKLLPHAKKDTPTSSMLDLHTYGLTDDDKVKTFLRAHGINLKMPNDQAYIREVFDESITFYDGYIARTRSNFIHKDLRETSTEPGVCRIFKTAAGHGRRVLIPQACGLLRIAYVTDVMKHDEGIMLMPKVTGALDEIVNRHVRTIGGKKHYHSGRDDSDPIPLVEATRRSKTLDRIRIKLLHKPSNHPSEVLDHIGFRFVTESAADTLRLIYKMFFDPHEAILPSAHIRILKTKQQLILPQLLQEALKSGSVGAIGSLSTMVSNNDKDFDIYSVGGTENKHSSDKYRAIQITVEIPLTINGRRILFPIEIQFLDKDALVKNGSEASHPEYVDRQMREVRERILTNNLETGFKELVSR